MRSLVGYKWELVCDGQSCGVANTVFCSDDALVFYCIDAHQRVFAATAFPITDDGKLKTAVPPELPFKMWEGYVDGHFVAAVWASVTLPDEKEARTLICLFPNLGDQDRLECFMLKRPICGDNDEMVRVIKHLYKSCGDHDHNDANPDDEYEKTDHDGTFHSGN